MIDLLPEVKAFLQQEEIPFWINNHPVSGVLPFRVINPATEETIAHVSNPLPPNVNDAVQSAKDAFVHWATTKPSTRAQLLWRLADLIEKHAAVLAQLETLNNGKPYREAFTRDIPNSVALLRYMAGWATKNEGQTIPISSDFFVYTTREPVGVVAAVIPWNFPLMLAVWKLAPALAAGCTIILKPAEQTPLSALYLGYLIREAGFPDGVVHIIPGYGETIGAYLAQHTGVDKIAFTGSTEVGRKIVQGSANDIKRVSLELGGKSPAIILKDADLTHAIPDAANAIFFNSGQCCSAGSRLLVEESIFNQVAEGVVDYAKRLRLGSGFDTDTDLGPLISKEQITRVEHYVEIGKQRAMLAYGGKKCGEQGYFFEPTVFWNVASSSVIAQDEIFGPVVTLHSFSDIDEAVTIANQSDYGLAAGVWTQNLSLAHLIASRLRVGTVWINQYNVWDAAMPFGGFKESGYGRDMGRVAIEGYTETKTVCIAL